MEVAVSNGAKKSIYLDNETNLMVIKYTFANKKNAYNHGDRKFQMNN
jgi:hypothetical protein